MRGQKPTVGHETRPDSAEHHAGTFRSRVFAQVDRYLARATDLLRGIWQGCGLGILGRDELDAMVAHYYRRQDIYRAEEWNTRGLFRWETNVVERHLDGCRTLLVGAAGGGREILALERQGFEVRGFDCNSNLVDWANEFLARSGARARVNFVPPDSVPDDGRRYDGIIMGWGGYAHIVGRSTRVRVLRQLRSKLAPGGLLLLSYGRMNVDNRRRLKVASIVGRQIFKIARPPDRDAISVGDSVDEEGYEHHFAGDQLPEELAEAGFDVAFKYDDRYQVPHLIAEAPSGNRALAIGD